MRHGIMFLYLRHNLCPVLLYRDVLVRHRSRSLLHLDGLVRSAERWLLRWCVLAWHLNGSLPYLDILAWHWSRSLLHLDGLVRSAGRWLLHRCVLAWHLDGSLPRLGILVWHWSSPERSLRDCLSLHGRLSRSRCARNRRLILFVCTLGRIKAALRFLVPSGSRVENWHRKTCLIIGVVVVYGRRGKRCL
mgnify:CR=1 FL=1